MKKIALVMFVALLISGSNIFAGSLHLHKTVTSATPATYIQYLDDWGNVTIEYEVQISAVAINYDACARVMDQTGLIVDEVCMTTGDYGTTEHIGTGTVQYGPVVGYEIHVYQNASVLEIYALAEASW